MMVEIKIKLTDEDIEILNNLKERKGYFLKDIKYEEKYNIGYITINPKRLIGEDYVCVDDFFELKFYFGAHEDEELIKNSAILTYTLAYENIIKVLIGQHLFANTTDGERISIMIMNK